MQNNLDLIGREDLDFGALHTRRFRRGHRVGDYHAPFDGMADNAMQKPVHMGDRAGRQAGTFGL